MDPYYCDVRTFAVALVYLKRAVDNRAIVLDVYTYHRALLVSLVVAQKYLDDITTPTTIWANIGGVTTRELNKLEVVFCKLSGWNFYVSETEQWTFINKLLYGETRSTGSVTI